MNEKDELCKKAEQFIRRLFKIYLEERNFPLFISMLHSDITWIGTGAQEICRNYSEALELLEAERRSWDGKFKILDQWYQTIPNGQDKYIVYGELDIVEDEVASFLMAMKSRFSMICWLENNEFKLIHAHFSVPSAAQKPQEFVHKELIENYNTMLEEKLNERTKLLKEKTLQLEMLTNNIYGGVEICRFEEGYPVEYISDGFSQLTGYTYQEIKDLFQGLHKGLVYEPDLHILNQKVKEQFEKSQSFSVEYRIVHKSGKIIWVIDRGRRIVENNSSVRVQCILTDITENKKQEEELLFSQKRYEIAMREYELSMFEYNVEKRELSLFEAAAKMYGTSAIVPNSVETFIKKGVVEPSSVSDYKEMYRKIHAGVPKASCYVKFRDVNGQVHDYELTLTNVFDVDGKPTRAIGVRKNISQMVLLRKEQEFGKNLVSDKRLVFEADITNNKIEFVDEGERQKTELSNLYNLQYVQTIKAVIKDAIAPEHKAIMLEKLSPDTIKYMFEKNNNLITLDYKQKNKFGEFIWYQAFINIIKDHITGNLRVRFYHMNINEQKIKEQQSLDKQQIYKSIISKVKLAYEVNITKDLIISGNENWHELYGISKTSNYKKALSEFCKLAIHKDEQKIFLNCFKRENIINMFQKGSRETSMQYRKISGDKKWRWHNCVMHLCEDSQTLDIKGFIYAEDIHEQKIEELALKYNAEHETMTGLLNRFTTEQHINGYLTITKEQKAQHAMLVVDIDYFKQINDTFGHLFGDEVIKEIASNIRSIFRQDDIVGRIGGDEFCVFIKNVKNTDIVKKKAEEVCKKILHTYSRGGKSCTISASVGIAVYSIDGNSYEELFAHADETLYLAKENGRNRYEI